MVSIIASFRKEELLLEWFSLSCSSTTVGLDGQTPTIPSGVFDAVRQSGEERVTWEPRSGVRSAIVVARFSGSSSGFVLAGRSLREAEKRIDAIGQIVLVGWGGILLVTLLAMVILLRKRV